MKSHILGVLLLALNGLTLAEMDMSLMCLNQKLGEHLPHPQYCSAFIVCGSEATVHRCPMGLHFDAKHKVCNWPYYANCQLEDTANDVQIQTVMATDVKTGLIVDSMKSYDAENVACVHFGAYFLPHPQSCGSYYLCAYGYMHQLRCGQGTMWNFKKQQCEIGYKAECYAKTAEEDTEMATLENECYRPAATTTDGQTTNTFNPTGSYQAVTDSTETTETFHPTGTYYSATATGTTADMGVSSVSGAATTTDGQTTNTFNPTGSYQAVTDSTETTEIFHTTGTYYSATATGTTADMGVSSLSGAATTTDGQTTNTFNPTGSYQAVTDSTETTETFHPTGTYYSATATGTIADMGVSSLSGAATTTDGQTTNTFNPTGSYQAVTDSTETTETFHPTGTYYSSTATGTTANIGVSYVSEANTTTPEQSSSTTVVPIKTTDTFYPSSTYYTATATKETTDDMGSSRAPKPTTDTTPEPSKAPNSSNPFSLECPDLLQSYIAHPEDCSKYFMCIKGMLVMTSCPPGLYWDAQKMFCDLPKFVKCFQ